MIAGVTLLFLRGCGFSGCCIMMPPGCQDFEPGVTAAVHFVMMIVSMKCNFLSSVVQANLLSESLSQGCAAASASQISSCQ